MSFEIPQIPNNLKTKKPNENLEKLRPELEKLYQEYILIVHQTHEPSAKKINSDAYFSHSGLEGTSLMASVDDVIKVAPELDKADLSQREVATHKGADSLVVMTFPRKFFSGPKMNLALADGVLVDMASEGKIQQFGLPNSSVFGYYHNGEFHKNPNFKPEAITNL